jgi:hypothetical protein
VLHTRTMPNKAPLYRERLLPGVMWWLFVAAIVAMIAIAYGAALGPPSAGQWELASA